MSKILDLARAVGVRNAHEFYNGQAPAGRVWLGYLPAARVFSARWQVWHATQQTDPEAHWTDNGRKSFLGDKTDALAQAQAWAGERYGITVWKRDPFGSYGDAAFVTARLAQLREQAKAQGYEAPALKVFAWRGRRNAAKMDGNHHAQTYEIVAAKSKAEAARIAGLRSAADVSETGNPEQVQAALANPGVLLWAPMNGPERNQYRPAGQVVA